MSRRLDRGDLHRIAAPLSCAQAMEAMEHGKHVLVEKPLALTLAECDAVVAAADRTGLQLIVGHTHAFDPNIREMQRIIQSGELGRLGMILTFNYNDFLLRPHRADEFDAEKGGGIAFNQTRPPDRNRPSARRRCPAVCAQMSVLWTARGRLRAIAPRSSSSRAAPRRRSSSAPMISSTATRWHHWIAEGGASKDPHRHGSTREAFLSRTSELEAHRDLGFGGRIFRPNSPICRISG